MRDVGDPGVKGPSMLLHAWVQREETNCSWVCMDVGLHVSGKKKKMPLGFKRLACSWFAYPAGHWPYSWALLKARIGLSLWAKLGLGQGLIEVIKV